MGNNSSTNNSSTTTAARRAGTAAWRSRSIGAAVLALLMVVAAACGDTGADDTAAPEELQQVRFRIDWSLGGEHTPYVLGIEKGFFEEEGLDVEFQEGTGSAVTAQLVGQRAADFGNVDTPPMILAAEQGIPITMIANFSPSSGFALLWVQERTDDLTGLEDLADLRIGVHQGSTEASVLPFVLAQGGIDMADADISQGPPPTTMYVALLEDRIDVLMCLLSCVPDINDMDPSLTYGHLDLRGYGIDLQAHGIVASNDVIADRPEVAAAFVRGAQRSWEYVLEDEAHQEEAVDTAVAAFPEAERRDLMEHLEDHLLTLRAVLEERAGRPLGWMDPDRWEETRQIMQEIAEEQVDIRLPPDVYYTNDFVDGD